MVRIGALFIAFCMVLIAGSVGAVLYLRFGFTPADAALIALGLLSLLAIYSSVAGRRTDRAAVGDQVASLARGSGDLARHVAAFDRRLALVESRVGTMLHQNASSDASADASPAQSLGTEIEELSRLVRQLADQVAQHDMMLNPDGPIARPAPPPVTSAGFVEALRPAASVPPLGGAMPEPPPPEAPPAAVFRDVPAFRGLTHDAIVAQVRGAIDGQKIDLYLQPIVTLPQRKVRYYEAMSRLNAAGGEVVAAGDFLRYAEAGALLPKLDSLSVLRCVQVVRRLLLKNREIGLFCNLAAATLTDSGFPQLLEFIEANRAIAPSLVFEFTQSALRNMGPIEHESLAALAERGFRFAMDNLTDLRVEPRELNSRGFRFVKVPASLLLNRVGSATANIHPADFSDLLGRFGIDLIAERIENESTVVDLLDYDVRFGQGFLFSPPRPVRAEALQGVAADAVRPDETAAPRAGDAAPAVRGLAQLVRTASGRT
jgi:cyclic-di-GMP phosphodiesterase TipF (flagellum assembly factor)